MNRNDGTMERAAEAVHLVNTPSPGGGGLGRGTPQAGLDQGGMSQAGHEKRPLSGASVEWGTARRLLVSLLVILGAACLDLDLFFAARGLLEVPDAFAERAADPSAIKELIKTKDKDIYLTRGIREALEKAKSLASKDDLILVTGSLFVVGEVKSALKYDLGGHLEGRI